MKKLITKIRINGWTRSQRLKGLDTLANYSNCRGQKCLGDGGSAWIGIEFNSAEARGYARLNFAVREGFEPT